jgi:hypothetical protein
MNELDILILAVYLISVAYIISLAIRNLDQQSKVWLNEDELKKDLEKRGLKDKVEISLKFEDRYLFSEQASDSKYPQELALSIKNKSDDVLYVDWDRSSISDLGGRSRRVVRLVPYKRLDLSYPQVFSAVSPGQSLSEKITAEDVLEPNAETTMLEPQKPLINIHGLKDSKDKKEKSRYEDFVDPEKLTPLSFYLWLVLRMPDPQNPAQGDRVYNIRCEILTQKRPWTDILPF